MALDDGLLKAFLVVGPGTRAGGARATGEGWTVGLDSCPPAKGRGSRFLFPLLMASGTVLRCLLGAVDRGAGRLEEGWDPSVPSKDQDDFRPCSVGRAGLVWPAGLGTRPLSLWCPTLDPKTTPCSV